MKLRIAVIIVFLIGLIGMTIPTQAQTYGTLNGVPFGPQLPIQCNPVSNSSPLLFFLNQVVATNSIGLYVCSSLNTWTFLGASSGGGSTPSAPAGSLQFNNQNQLGGADILFVPNGGICKEGVVCNGYETNSATGQTLDFGPTVDSGPTSGNGDQVNLNAVPYAAGGTNVSITSTGPALISGILNNNYGLLSRSAVIGSGGQATGVEAIATDDFSDTNNGQVLRAISAAIGLSKLAGSISTGVGLDVLPTQSWALNGGGTCCNNVTETAANMFGIRIGNLGPYSTTEQAGIVILAQTFGTGQNWSIDAQTGSGQANFSDGIVAGGESFNGTNIPNPFEVLYNSATNAASGASGFTYNPTSQNVAMPTTAQIGTNLTVGGNWQMLYGPLPLVTPNADGWAGPSQGVAGGVLRLLPGYPGGGVLQGFAGMGPNGSNYVKYSSSGDPNHSSGRVLNQTGPIPQTVVCSFAFCQQGGFKVIVHVSSAATCSVVGSAGVAFTAYWADENGSHNAAIPLIVNGSTLFSSSIPLGNVQNTGFGEIGIYNISGSNISYSATITPCTTGNATYNFDIETREDL